MTGVQTCALPILMSWHALCNDNSIMALKRRHAKCLRKVLIEFQIGVSLVWSAPIVFGQRSLHSFTLVHPATTRKESTSEAQIPSQKFKYRRKRLLARVYDPRRPSYLLLLLKDILRPYLRK